MIENCSHKQLKNVFIAKLWVTEIFWLPYLWWLIWDLVAIKETMIIGWRLKPFFNHHKIGNWKFSIVGDWIFQGGMQYVFGKLLTNAITRWPNDLKITVTYDQKSFQLPNSWWSKNFNHLTYGNQKSTLVAIWKGLIVGWRPKSFKPILWQSKKNSITISKHMTNRRLKPFVYLTHGDWKQIQSLILWWPNLFLVTIWIGAT